MNMPHVATLQNRTGEFEPFVEEGDLNLDEVIRGVAELNSNGIILLNIRAGVSAIDGKTKISSVDGAGLYRDGEWIVEPQQTDDGDLPEENIVPFKSDSWVLGEYIVRHTTGGKTIPRRFTKSQTLLDRFCAGNPYEETLKKLLVIDPENRKYTWEISPPTQVTENPGCSLM